MSFRTAIPVDQVRGHVVRVWHRREPELMGWSARPTDVYVFLLDDGRLVGQDWDEALEFPTRHYLKASPERAQKKIDEQIRPALYEELRPEQVVIIAGRYAP